MVPIHVHYYATHPPTLGIIIGQSIDLYELMYTFLRVSEKPFEFAAQSKYSFIELWLKVDYLVEGL
jgi:hypothetical protein